MDTIISMIREDFLSHIDQVVLQSITQGYYPGAVVLVCHQDAVIYQKAFGNRRVVPDSAPMQIDTIFDLASLTKVVVTTTAIMQLLEQGEIELDDPVVKYWPDFALNDKHTITIRQLLTHTSGLPIFMPKFSPAGDRKARYAMGLQQVAQLSFLNPAGSTLAYSDVSMGVLGYLVELISQKTLDVYASHHIFQPLGMTETGFAPSHTLKDRIAPTECDEKGQIRWGEVHDPGSFRMGGVTGIAGLFSTALDLSLFVRCLLSGGKIPGKEEFLLSPLSILKMTTPQTPLTMEETRGLGWDLDSVYSNRGTLLPIGSYGHTGFTGTSLWLDPHTQTGLVILTSRLHPKPCPPVQGKSPLVRDRRRIANIVAGSLIGLSTQGVRNTGQWELIRAYKSNDD